MRRHGKHLALWGFTFLFTFLLSELVLRVAALASPAVYGALYHHRVPDTRLGWRFDPSFPDIDARGFRNDQILDRADIVVLGDSQSYGYGVPMAASWPRQLAARTGRSTYTMAGSGYGPGHSLLLWDEAVELNPGLVIEALYSGNDLYDAYDLVYGRGQLPHLQTADPRLRTHLSELERDDPLSERAQLVTRMGRPTWPLRDLLRDHSRMYGIIRCVDRSSDALSRSLGAPLEWEEVRQRALERPAYCDVYDDGRVRTVFTPRKRHLALDLADPRLREGRRLALAAIEEMQRRARDAGIGFAVVLVPTKEYVFAPRVRALGASDSPVLAKLLEREAELWDDVRAHLSARGIPWVDGLPALRRRLDRGDCPYRITADGHPNAVGYGAIAERVADFLSRRGI